MARVSEFRYGKFLSEVVRKKYGQNLKYLNNFGVGKSQDSIHVTSVLIYMIHLGWGMIPDGDAQIMVDNHDNQRGHGSLRTLFSFLVWNEYFVCWIGAGGDILTFFDSRLYKIATAFMLAWPYGKSFISSDLLTQNEAFL